MTNLGNGCDQVDSYLDGYLHATVDAILATIDRLPIQDRRLVIKQLIDTLTFRLINTR